MLRYEMQQAVEAMAHKVCSHLGRPPVTITWTGSVPTAAISGMGHMYLKGGLPDDHITRAEFLRFCGYVLHELLHWVYTDFSVRANGQYLASLHNAVEDAWIEQRGIDAVLTGNIDPLLRSLIDGMVQESLAQVQDWADPRQYPFALAVYLRKHATVKVPLAAGLEPVFAEAARRMVGCQNSGDTLAVAEWVFKQLSLPPSQDSQDKPEPQPGDKQEGEGEGDGEGDGEGEGEGEDQQQAGQRQQVMSSDDPAVQVEPTCPGADEGGGHSGTYTNRPSQIQPLYMGNGSRSLTCNAAKLRREIRMLLENTASTEHDRNRRAGQINVRALHKAGHDDRLFQRRNELEGIDSAVSIMVDRSYSMDGQPIATACTVAAALYDAAKAAQASVRVSAFGDSVFTAPWNATSQVAQRAMRSLKTNGGTDDYLALRWASEDLLARPEPRKVLIMLTDGGGYAEMCRQWAESLGRMGMLVLGIGIHTELGHIYENTVTVNDIKKLGEMTFNAVIKALR